MKKQKGISYTFCLLLLLCSCFMSQTAYAQISITPSPDIIIDAGHGGIDSGTAHYDLVEKEINMEIAKMLYSRLNKKGFHVVLNRAKDYALSEDNTWLRNNSRHLKDLAQRKHLAKTLRPQVLVSLHVNWSTNAKASGPVVLYQKNNQSYILADLMQHSLNEYYRTNIKPRQGKTYYLLKHSICPTIIVEMGYLSNAHDRQVLTQKEEQKKLASAIEKALVEYYSIMNGIIQNEEEMEDNE